MNQISDSVPVISWSHRLRNYFLTGILVSAPVVLTFYVTILFLDFVDRRVAGLLPSGLYPEGGIPGFGLVIGISFFVIIGWFATNFMGRLLIGLSESIVERMPVVRTIYSGFKQVFEMVMGKQARAFREAVLVEFPMENSWAIGFVTGTTQGEIQARTTDTVMNVFVPTTPNPTSGYLIFVPKERVVYLDMPVDDALKMVISGGIITPPDRRVVEASIIPEKVGIS